jgi:hypothetical protein
MRQFTLVAMKTIDGVDAAIPSIRECESWAATEEEAISAVLDRLAWFLRCQPGFRHTLDFMREEDGKRYYKVFIRE